MSWKTDVIPLARAALALALLLVAASCGSSTASSPVQVVPIEATWGDQYADLASLTTASDVTIVGTVIRVAGTTVSHRVPFTDFTVRVVRTLRDPQSRLASSPTIVVHQTGGQMTPNRVFEVRDDPLFASGETMVLFLHQYAPGRFYVLGGPTGRFEVTRGEVSSRHGGTVRLPAHQTVDELARTVASS